MARDCGTASTVVVGRLGSEVCGLVPPTIVLGPRVMRAGAGRARTPEEQRINVADTADVSAVAEGEKGSIVNGFHWGVCVV